MFSEPPLQISVFSSTSTSVDAYKRLGGDERRSKKISIIARKTTYIYALNIYEKGVV